MNKTKHAQFVKFREELKRQVIRLGLKSWDTETVHGVPCEGPDENDATTTYSIDGKTAVFVLNSKFTHRDPRRTAKHEAAHLLLAPLESLAERRFTSAREVQDAVESICIVLEKVL